MGKVANVAEAMQREVARDKKVGPTVKVRAIRKGFYGYPLADVRDPGTEFRMRVADLLPYDEAVKKGKNGKNYLGHVIKFVKVGKDKYALPTWCEDANEPSSLDIVDPDDEPRDEGDEVL
ncbi:MAG TPA: hypothetical protein VGI97_14760 [Gemmatimonadaceae bacterium]|jgi:hypothetical protein